MEDLRLQERQRMRDAKNEGKSNGHTKTSEWSLSS
jgi:hypothetical protein